MSRVAVILFAAAVCIVTGVAYAGAGNLAFVAVLLSDGMMAGLWVAAAGLGGWVILRGVIRDLHLYERGLVVSTSAALGLGVYSLAILGLGLLGWLNRWTVLVLPVLSIVSFCICYMRNPSPDLKGRLEKWLSGKAAAGWLWLAVMPTLGLGLAAGAQPPGVLWPRSGDPQPYDVLEYHLQLPREWYEAGRIEKPLHNAFGFFPFNAEMQFLAAMHLRGGPWDGMYTAQYLSLAYAVLMVVGVYGIGKQLTGNAVAAIAGGVAAGTVPWVGMLGSIAYNESALMLYGVLGVGWVCVAIGCVARQGKTGLMEQEKHGRGARATNLFFVAGVMAGFGCGVKYTGVPMLLIGVPVAAVLVSIKGMSVRLLRNCAVYVLAGVVVFSPWLIRNYVWAGNPVFPEAAGVLGRGHFTEAQVARWQRAHSAAESQKGLDKRLGAFWNETVADGRYGFVFPIGVIGLGVLAWRWREAQLMAVMIVLLAVFWVFMTHLQSRFFVLAVPLGGVLIAIGAGQLSRQLRLVPVGAGVLIGAVGLGIIQNEYTKNLAPFRGVSPLGLRELHYMLGDPSTKLVESAGVKVALVGDARAFLYKMPMKNLRYRTVFDIAEDGAAHFVDAFIGADAEGVRREYHLQIDPDEVERLNASYRLGFKDWPPKGATRPATRPSLNIGPSPD